MSYILDALRRAQAERERGQVPGLHAQPGLGATQRMRPASNAPSGRPAWVWALAGAGVVVFLLASILLLMRGSGPQQPGVVAGPAATPPEQPPAPAPAPAQQPQPPLVVVAAAPTPRVAAGGGVVAPAGGARSAGPSTAMRQSPPPPATAQAGAPGAGPAPQAPVAAVAQPAAPASPDVSPQQAPVSTRTPVTPPVASATAAALPPPLTADQRRDWPPLAVGGSVWSDSASARFVILGGQVVREGETTADGVLVERITPKAVVLRWRDQRGSLPF